MVVLGVTLLFLWDLVKQRKPHFFMWCPSRTWQTKSTSWYCNIQWWFFFFKNVFKNEIVLFHNYTFTLPFFLPIFLSSDARLLFPTPSLYFTAFHHWYQSDFHTRGRLVYSAFSNFWSRWLDDESRRLYIFSEDLGRFKILGPLRWIFQHFAML